MLINFFLLISFSRLFLLKLRWFVLVNLVPIAGDLNADPAVIPCLAEGISAGRFVDLALLGRGLLRIRSRHLGGRAVGGRGSGRLYRASQCDEVDAHCGQYFVNSSLAPVVLFRRRLKSVADVLKGIRDKGFTQSRWDALLGYWEAVCRHGPCGPISSLHPWDRWTVRGVSWSLLATVPKRKSRRSLDMNFLWTAEKGVWKVWKKSNGTERKRRRVKRTTTTQHTDDHAWME